jgi:hypothetical protein
VSSAAFLMAHFEFLQCRKCHFMKPPERKVVFKPHNAMERKEMCGGNVGVRQLSPFGHVFRGTLCCLGDSSTMTLVSDKTRCRTSIPSVVPGNMAA